MMDKQYFIWLLQKLNRGEATTEEEQFLISYYNLFQPEEDLSTYLSEEKKETLKNQIRFAIHDNLYSRENEGKLRTIFPWRRVAAVAAVLIIVSAVVFYMNPAPAEKITYATKTPQQKENRFIRLPDGSTVIVSAGSKLNYPSSFDGTVNREVYLEGQAFFDIKHNPAKAFIVHTGKLSTTVLGTAFNVKAIPSEDNITVTVTRGKVRVSSPEKTLGLIEPDEQIVYSKAENEAVQSVIEDKNYLGWKEQDLLFDDVTLAEAAELLEERFKVKIAFSDPLIKDNRFTTTFRQDQKLEQVLKSICEFNSAVFQYDRDNATVMISSK
jgi:transmembrane sensor